MRGGVEFHCCLYRRHASQRERDSTTRPTGGPRATTRRPTTAGSGSGQPWTSNGFLHWRLGTTPPASPAGGAARARRAALLFRPVQGHHHQHELETPTRLQSGRGKGAPNSGGGLRRPGYRRTSRSCPRSRSRSLPGACGSENWGGVPAAGFAARETFRSSQRRRPEFTLSRPVGAAGTFTCALDGRHGRVHRSLRQPAPGRH